jgi:hypothetical protein
MSEKQHRSGRSRRMEEDLNKSSFRSGDHARPPPEKVPRASRAEPMSAPKGNESFFQLDWSSQSLAGSAAQAGQGAIPVVATQKAQPLEGNAACGSAEARGGGPEGVVHGADYGGQVATKFKASLVSDAEAASRSEYRYRIPGQSSRTPAYEDPSGRPRSRVRGSSPRSSSDHRRGESQSSNALELIEGVMLEMGRQFAAATSALLAASSTARSASPSPGKFNSYIFILYCRILPYIVRNLCYLFSLV